MPEMTFLVPGAFFGVLSTKQLSGYSMPHPLVKPLPSRNIWRNSSCVRFLALEESSAPIWPENIDENFVSKSMSCLAIVKRSLLNVARTDFAEDECFGTTPFSTCASFQERLKESIIETFIPCPALGLCVWQAVGGQSVHNLLNAQKLEFTISDNKDPFSTFRILHRKFSRHSLTNLVSSIPVRFCP